VGAAITDITAPVPRAAAFKVRGWIHFLGGLIATHPALCVKLGNLETKYLADEVAKIRIDRPIYIAGLARSGTTILLEILAAQPGIGTHRYRDFPAVLTPYLWNWWLTQARATAGELVERAHSDGILVNAESPEAMEEMVWMAFFSWLHDSGTSSVLDGTTANAEFEKFYRDHLRKLLIVRRAHRYAAKDNYNLTRMAYLRRLFSDARFVIPLRHPTTHIASLIKEHRLFSAAHRQDPRTVDHLRRVGHFEFGVDLRPINVGDPPRVDEIQALWQSGEEVRGWARYWAMIYGFVADQLAADSALRDAALIARFEDLCDHPAATLERFMRHCELDPDPAVAAWTDRLHTPTYYTARFSTADQAAIDDETRTVRRRFGYD
jgi:hypothetical protein